MVAPRPDLLRDEYSTLTIMILLKQGMRLPLPLPSVLKWKAKTKQAPWEFRNKKTFHELLLGVTETVTPLNQQPHAAYINESGLYSLVLRSKKPQAKSFKRWVMNDVWWGFAGRQLRREGGNETFPPSPSPSPPASLEEGCT